MVKRSIGEVGVTDLVEAGLATGEAEQLYGTLRDVLLRATSGRPSGPDPREVWRELVARRALKPSYPHRLHQLLYYSVYSTWDSAIDGPPLYWFPSL